MKLTWTNSKTEVNIPVEEFQLLGLLEVYRNWFSGKDVTHSFTIKTYFCPECSKAFPSHQLATWFPSPPPPWIFEYLCSQITSSLSFRLPGSNNKSYQSTGSFLLLLIGQVFYSTSAEPSGSQSGINSCLEDYLYSNKYVAIYFWSFKSLRTIFTLESANNS